jgi:hypothetical protein
MIFTVNRLRSLAAALVAALATCIAPLAYAAEEGWFDPNRPPSAGRDSAAATDGAPAPLAPSPLLAGESRPPVDANDQSPEALTTFRPYLDPHGVWIDDPSYGRVWVPNPSVVGPNFQPYVSNGRWALDEQGEWIWVSDYSFGWVVFHYGRWVWIPAQGWAWIPGLRYAPAWVVWRVPTGSHAYVGWAPAPPTFVWFGGVAVYYGYDPYYPWVFCPSHYLFHHHVHYYVVRDHYWVGYAARNTRPYVPASPRPRNGNPTVMNQPRPRSPSFSAARIPPQAVPRERTRTAYASDARELPSSRSDADRRSLKSEPSSRSIDTRPDRSDRPSYGSRNREARPAARGTHRLSPSKAPARSRPDTRVSPRSRRPERR